MKKRLFYLMFVAFAAMSVSMITFTSCSSNDNADEVLPAKEEVSNLLIGRWNLVGNYNSEGKEIDQQMPGESISFDVAGRMLKQWFNVKRSSYRWTVYEADGKLYLMVDVELKNLMPTSLNFITRRLMVNIASTKKPNNR